MLVCLGRLAVDDSEREEVQIRNVGSVRWIAATVVPSKVTGRPAASLFPAGDKDKEARANPTHSGYR